MFQGPKFAGLGGLRHFGQPDPVPDPVSWRGFSPVQRNAAWDRLADATANGTPAEMASAREYLINGPAS
jgi:hypothetical protein